VFVAVSAVVVILVSCNSHHLLHGKSVIVIYVEPKTHLFIQRGPKNWTVFFKVNNQSIRSVFIYVSI